MSDTLLMLLEMIEEVLEEQGEVVDLGTEADDEDVMFYGGKFPIEEPDPDKGGIIESRAVAEQMNTTDKFEDIMFENDTGALDSEVNLKDAINHYAQAKFDKDGKFIESQGFAANIPQLGEVTVMGALKRGGGAKEPKADISILYEGAEGKIEELGLSMKKPNFGFYQNRMSLEVFDDFLTQSGMSKEGREKLKKHINDVLNEVMERTAGEQIKAEREAFVKFLGGKDPGDLKPLIKGESPYTDILNSDEWGEVGKFKNPYKITNVYFSLRETMEKEAFKEFIKIIIKGGKDNAFKADAVLVKAIKKGIGLPELKAALDDIENADVVVQEYVENENLDMRFRLRPMTEVRTTYSGSNRSHYRRQFAFYPTHKVAWSVFVIKGKRRN